MSDYTPYPTIDSSQLLMSKLMSSHIQEPSDFDPYTALLKKKKDIDSGNISIKNIDPDDQYELQQFCIKYGVVGFNTGTMNPKAALRMLKSKMGIKETPTELSSKKELICG